MSGDDIEEFRATVHSLVDSASREALDACEVVLLQFSSVAPADDPSSDQRRRCEGPSRRVRARRASYRRSRAISLADVATAADDSVRDSVNEEQMHLVSYDTKFVYSVSRSTLIGDRFNKEDVSGQDVINGIYEEFQNYTNQVDKLRAAGREDEANVLFRWGRGFHLPPCYVDALTGQNANPKFGVVQLYAAETGVYPAVNMTMRDHDETKVGLRAFVRLLHDSLSDPISPMFRWTGTCYRWMALPHVLLEQYEIQSYELNNYISYAGFTSASRTAEATWWNRVQFCVTSNVLLVIEQGDDGPTDISFLSDYPEEAEVMYSLGQTFKKERKTLATFDELCNILGPPPLCAGWTTESFDVGSGPVTVVYLTAVDPFHELAEDLYRGGGTEEEAMPLLQKRLQHEIDCGRDFKLREARALLTLGKAHGGAGKYLKAKDYIDRSIQIRRALHCEQHPDVAECLYEHATVDLLDAQYEQAKHMFEQSWHTRCAQLGSRAPATADSLVGIGRSQRMMQNFDEALHSLRDALSIYEEAKGEKHPKVAFCQRFIGAVLADMGDHEGAQAAYASALAINHLVLGCEHPEVGTDYHGLAVSYQACGNYSAAREAFQNSLRIHQKVLGEMHPEVARLYYNMGITLENMGEGAQALDVYQKALDIRGETLGLTHPDVGNTLYNMALLHKKDNDLETARVMFQESALIFDAKYGAEHRQTKDARRGAAACEASVVVLS